MAQATVSIDFDTDAVVDAAMELATVRAALVKRHGERFRDLERRIDEWAEGLDAEAADIPMTNVEGLYIVGAPAEMADLLREARSLGVIG